jgi:hypothetical protein
MIHNIKFEWLPNGGLVVFGERLEKEKHEVIPRYLRKEYSKQTIKMLDKFNISFIDDFIQSCNRL